MRPCRRTTSAVEAFTASSSRMSRAASRPPAIPGDLRSHRVELRRRPAAQDDRRAEGRELVGHAAPDAAAAAGHDVDLALEQAGRKILR